MTDDLPVPRAPHNSTLLDGSPARNRSVLRASSSFCRSIPVRSDQVTGSSRRIALSPDRYRRHTAAGMRDHSKGASPIRLLRFVLSKTIDELAFAAPVKVGFKP